MRHRLLCFCVVNRSLFLAILRSPSKHKSDAPRLLRAHRRCVSAALGLHSNRRGTCRYRMAGSSQRQDTPLENFERLRYNHRMNASLKITKIGNSAGVVLPKELLAKLRAGVGDTLYVSETPDGIRITAADPSFEDKLSLAEQIMREDRDILRVLAK